MPLLPPEELERQLERYGTAGISVAVLQPAGIVTQTAGLASKEPPVPMFDSTWLEIASLSKTFAAAFALEYFTPLGIGMDAPVNPLLREAGSTFVLRSAEGSPPEWAERVTLAQLVNHSGLGMHYVNGVPLSEPMPPMLDLISGSAAAPAPYGYACIDLVKEPGTQFGYSGGGFLLLQHLLELREGRPIASLMAPFLRAGGTAVSLGLSFETKDVAGKHYAAGYRDDGSRVGDGRLMFPPLAAGALGTPAALMDWLRQLALAYKRPEGCGAISHVRPSKAPLAVHSWPCLTQLLRPVHCTGDRGAGPDSGAGPWQRGLHACAGGAWCFHLRGGGARPANAQQVDAASGCERRLPRPLPCLVSLVSAENDRVEAA